MGWIRCGANGFTGISIFQLLPDFFRYEWHKRMGKPQNFIKQFPGFPSARLPKWVVQKPV
jgi:hypothetical protein